jgi:hypothetical protein
MLEILFVHGTGVRLRSYDAALSLVRKQAAKYLNGAKVHQCLWGDPLGAKLHFDGASIPTYEDTPGHIQSESEAEFVEQASLRMLGEDPLFEVRLLQTLPAPQRERGPNEMSPGKVSFNLVRNLNPSPDFFGILREKDLEDYWSTSHNALVNKPELAQILGSVNRDPREVSRALARALVASLMCSAIEDGHSQISAATRKELVDLLIPDLGGQALAPFDWITKPLIGIAKHIGATLATYKARRARRALTDAAFPCAGDIVLYQAHGDDIRRFISDRIREKTSDLIVIAHSLGGIAAVDLLIKEDFSDRVKGIVTVGSQAPFLYEIDALVSLRSRQALPAHFPKKWLNIWDPNDFLSYIGEGVFGPEAVVDFMVKSGLSFPDSHGAYWDQTDVWTKIQGFFPWA